MTTRKRKRPKKKGKVAHLHELETPTEQEVTPLKVCASSSNAPSLNLPEEASAIADPNSLTSFLNSLSPKADEERMKTWNSEELMNFGSTRIFQGLLAHVHASHRMNEMKTESAKHKNENIKLTISNCELKNRAEQALAESHSTRTKLETTEKEKHALQEDNPALQQKIEHMDESMKFIASRSHLKTKYDLFKEWELHGGKEWDREKTYAAWERCMARAKLKSPRRSKMIPVLKLVREDLPRPKRKKEKKK